VTHVILKAGREKSLQRRHPWVFSGAIQSVDSDPAPGATVEVVSAGGEFLGRGAYSPISSIRVRMWTFEDEPVDDDFLRARVRAAIALRDGLPKAHPDDNSRRLVYAETDGLPGLVADRYGDFIVVQALSTGAEVWREPFAAILAEEAAPVRGIYERSDVDVRELEGLPQRSGPLFGEKPPEFVRISENGLAFEVDIRAGQKTGFYLDQAANRRQVMPFAAGKRVLNCFSYTGGFSVYALAGGAREVVSVDSSAPALETARRNAALNGLGDSRVEYICADVFYELRRMRDSGEVFDMIILDPPKFAPTSAHAPAAARGYKDINLLAIKLLAPGGLLVTFSCSGGVSRELFHKIISGAALDAGAHLSIVDILSQSGDHPVSLDFPESEYLKGLICRKRE
jgi:23S rRNA (cytosine1962-C5)-methyltransferase